MSKHEVVLVDFHRRRPFTVLTTGEFAGVDYCNVEYSRLDQKFYYNNSGFRGFPIEYEMPPNDQSYYWLNPKYEDRVTVIGGRRIKRSKYAAMPWNYAIQDYVIWCEKCQDLRPSEGAWRPCEHIEWCDECGDWKTENEDNYCEHEIED